MSMEIVNGYLCGGCNDVAFTKKNIDPAHPKVTPNTIVRALVTNFTATAIGFGGAWRAYTLFLVHPAKW
ncbi:hypothetical protein PsB1_1739 [Candidatus Phycosocius spiralis]|uniref:Uncharacterized protein n=1 Tax=Candidatus Phycosocius spiralis TaxID=2815099 RepID=A0ABQ4PX72_9PROT|nr:hypothetical protein PsB1_1739 [Candidatus Phycosocius spiralis]